MSSPTPWTALKDGRLYRQHYNASTGMWELEWWNPNVQVAPVQPSCQTQQGHHFDEWNSSNQDHYSSQPSTSASVYHFKASPRTAAPDITGTSPKRGLQRGEGHQISGLFDPSREISDTNLNYEQLDKTYFIQKKSFFTEGRVLAIMWSETASETSHMPLDYNTSRSYSRVKYQDHWVHTNVRRFIIIRTKSGHCYGCPIFTYTGRGTTKPGLRPEEHGIVYSEGESPKLITNDRSEIIETGITKASVCVKMAPGVPALGRASRIYYGIHHAIQYNVRVKNIGMVLPEYMPTLIGNHYEEELKDLSIKQPRSIIQSAEVSPSNQPLQSIAGTS